MDNFHTVLWFQIFLSNTNNLQIDLSDLYMDFFQLLPLQFRVNQGVTAIKEWITLPKAPELETHPGHLFRKGSFNSLQLACYNLC